MDPTQATPTSAATPAAIPNRPEPLMSRDEYSGYLRVPVKTLYDRRLGKGARALLLRRVRRGSRGSVAGALSLDGGR
jgi:hypothetical protein